MIEIEDLSFSYRRNKRVFSSLGLNLGVGHVYGLLGKNGAGKSTLLKLISGLLFPCAGRLEVMGFCPKFRQPSFLSDLFLIPEEIWLPGVKMREYVGMVAPFYPRFDREQLTDLMCEFEVSEDEKLDSLSYGQKKKALICFGLACNTRLLLMDEPTNGLDIPAKSEFRRMIASVATEDRCIVISTHQVRDLESLIDAIVILDESRVLINATTGEITEKFVFKLLSEGETALFEDVSLKGRWGVKRNEKQEESKLDMELFFNAVLQYPAEMEQMLCQKSD